MSSDPFTHEIWNGLVRGTKIDHPYWGLCEFYRYSPKSERVEMFDRYGIQRTLTPKELLEIPEDAITKP